MPARARKIVLVAHCHLNVNTKVKGLARLAGARAELIADLAASNVGIVQLPCPEVTYLGMKRWGMTREQYDTPAFRRHCAAILAPVVDTIVALTEDGCAVTTVYGVDGSPSCGVQRTCTGYNGGEIEDLIQKGRYPHARDEARPGVFFEMLQRALEEHGVHPQFVGIDERSASGAGGS